MKLKRCTYCQKKLAMTRKSNLCAPCLQEERELSLMGDLPQEPTEWRPCLGWCGKKIKTTKGVRFCKLCTERKAFAAGNGMEHYEVLAQV